MVDSNSTQITPEAGRTASVVPAAGSAGSGQRRREVPVDRSQKLLGGQPFLVRTHQQGEILGHLALLDGLDADALKGLGERRHLGGPVKLASVLEATGPRVC